MDITRRFVGRTAIIDLKGRVAVGPAEVELAPLVTAINELTGSGYVDVAVNLAGVTQLDARGLGELVCASTVVQRGGGRFRLVAPSARVARMLAVTRIDRVLEICDIESELAERPASALRVRRSQSYGEASP